MSHFKNAPLFAVDQCQGYLWVLMMSRLVEIFDFGQSRGGRLGKGFGVGILEFPGLGGLERGFWRGQRVDPAEEV